MHITAYMLLYMVSHPCVCLSAPVRPPGQRGVVPRQYRETGVRHSDQDHRPGNTLYPVIIIQPTMVVTQNPLESFHI